MSQQTKPEDHLDYFLESMQHNIAHLAQQLDTDFYRQAVQLIAESEEQGGRVHVTGVGKPGHLASYIASLVSSTGTPAYFLDATEAVHGSSGQVRQGDVVIAISNSGETQELKATVSTLKSNSAKIIAVTGNRDSWLAKQGDAVLYAPAQEEGGPLNRAPRNSIISEICVLQGLSVLLQSGKQITPQQYVKWHSGGSLGKLRGDEMEL